MTATIHYVTGDATQPIGTGTRVIAHVVNDLGGWGKGFVLALSAQSPRAEIAYREWASRCKGVLPLGQTQFVHFDADIYVANMVAQHGYKSADNPVPLRHEALEQCLLLVRDWAHDREVAASVHCPRLGCGLGGATWPAIEPIIKRALSGLDVYVFDLEAKR